MPKKNEGEKLYEEAKQLVKQMDQTKVVKPMDMVKRKTKAALDDWVPSFLNVLINLGHKDRACDALGLDKKTVQKRINIDTAFALAVKNAEKKKIEEVEHTMYQLATGKIKKPVWYQGYKVGEEPTYSENMVKFLLEKWYPEKYGKVHDDDAVDKNNSSRPPVDLENLTLKDLQALERIKKKVLKGEKMTTELIEAEIVETESDEVSDGLGESEQRPD